MTHLVLGAEPGPRGVTTGFFTLKRRGVALAVAVGFEQSVLRRRERSSRPYNVGCPPQPERLLRASTECEEDRATGKRYRAALVPCVLVG
jgi:hypothetical protein